MNNFRLPILAMASLFLGACSANDKSANGCENNMPDSAGLNDEWRLDSYRIDCRSTQFGISSNYKLSINEPDSMFSLTTDCNLINGEVGIADDTIRFKNMLVTEMACDNMTVEQNMLRLLNDSRAYAVYHADTLRLTAPYIGSAIFIRHGDLE